MIYADSSFLLRVYANEPGSSDAHAYLTANQPRLPFIFLHWPEVAKALWTNYEATAETSWEMIRADLEAGEKLFQPEINVENTARRAAGLMRHYCPRWKKLRALDALHVAAAVEGRFTTFLSFDSSSYQRVLAHDQKLAVWPPLTADEKLRLKQK